jgi:ABC-type antimicrobial peptide transport system permease subunit
VAPVRNGLDYFLRRRFGESLYAVFGLCGAILLMACVSLTSLLLARSLSRYREVAIRLAVVDGGSAATVSLQKAIAGLLYGVRASDLPLLALSIAVLTATAVVAAWIPVRRASIIDPARALHHD